MPRARTRIAGSRTQSHTHNSNKQLLLMMMNEIATKDEAQRSELCRLLEERGVSDADTIVAGLEDVEGGLATVAYYDDQPRAQGAGLLIYLLRKGGAVGYRRPGERSEVPSSAVSPALAHSIRNTCRSPNGITRDEVRGILADKAKRMRRTPDSLIDEVMGADWQESPTHEALSKDGTAAERLRRYERWVAEER